VISSSGIKKAPTIATNPIRINPIERQESLEFP